MNSKVRLKQLWIGLVEVRPLKGCDVLEDAKGAFVNVVTWATNSDEYRSNAELVFRKMRLAVAGIEGVEPVEARRARMSGPFEESIEEVISRAEGNPSAIIYSTFHLFEKGDA